MNQQDKNLATSDLLYSLKNIAELKGYLDFNGHSVYTENYKQKVEIVLEAIKSAIQIINKGE